MDQVTYIVEGYVNIAKERCVLPCIWAELGTSKYAQYLSYQRAHESCRCGIYLNLIVQMRCRGCAARYGSGDIVEVHVSIARELLHIFGCLTFDEQHATDGECVQILLSGQ